MRFRLDPLSPTGLSIVNPQVTMVSSSTTSSAAPGSGNVDSVVAGSNIDVDATDPANPIVSVETLTVADISDITSTVTELNYTDGVTSAIQTQLDAKQPLDSDLTTIAGLTATTNNFMVASSSAWASRTPTQAIAHLGLDADLATLSLPASTTITAAAATVLDDATVGAMVDTLGGASSTGTGGLARATSPTFVTPILGTPTSGTLTNATGLPIAGLVPSTSTAIGVGSVELGHASDTTLSRSAAGVLAVEGVVIPSISSTNTLTNKRVTKRTGTAASSATPTINTDNVDFYSLTAQAEAITSFTTNLSGTPTEGQTLWIAITGTAARGITWGASFEASTVALPTTTVSTNRLDVGFVWNTVSSKWRCVATC